MRRKESLYAVIGGIVGAVLSMAVCSFLPLGAQSQSNGKFREITCTELKVVDAAGKTKVSLDTFGFDGRVEVFGKTGSVALITNEDGGRVGVYGRAGDVILANDGDGGQVWVSGGKVMSGLRAVMGVDDYGNGAVAIWDKNGNPLAVLK